MKHVFTNAELPHVFAHKRQAEGRASSMFFEGDLFFSYGRHYCVARHLPDGYVAINLMQSSPTTERHKAGIRYATNHLKRIYVFQPEGPPAQSVTRRHVEHLLQEAAKAKPDGKRPYWLGRAKTVTDDYNTFCDLVDRPQYKIEPVEASDETLAQIKASIAHVRKQELARQKLREQQIAESKAKQIADWRLGLINRAPYGAATMLRLGYFEGGKFGGSHQTVETSRGARIPVDDAKRLWPVILRVMGGERDYEVGMDLGGYKLTKICRSGDIVVGCHSIPFSEIVEVARLLGLLKVEEPVT